MNGVLVGNEEDEREGVKSVVTYRKTGTCTFGTRNYTKRWRHIER